MGRGTKIYVSRNRRPRHRKPEHQAASRDLLIKFCKGHFLVIHALSKEKSAVRPPRPMLHGVRTPEKGLSAALRQRGTLALGTIAYRMRPCDAEGRNLPLALSIPSASTQLFSSRLRRPPVAAQRLAGATLRRTCAQPRRARNAESPWRAPAIHVSRHLCHERAQLHHQFGHPGAPGSVEPVAFTEWTPKATPPLSVIAMSHPLHVVVHDGLQPGKQPGSEHGGDDELICCA